MKRFALNVAAIFFGLAACCVARAEYFLDGNTLNEFCTSAATKSRLIVRGYAMAIADGEGVGTGIIDDATGSPVFPRRFVCVPIGVSAKQAEDLVCNYLSAHPEIRQMPGTMLVHNALHDAWPCAQK
ncbi:hypothetical protein NKH81_20485 [Mesorhizobium sp. M0959]|uniref:Rap1a/Tai family immunity protein n=1 Tax=Mesorhizobium sp. M0959 TaxID=2957034 RepID=UPI00333A66DF